MKEVYCGWVCKECCEKYDWVEDRVLPIGKVVECENCLKEVTGEN